MQGEAAGLGCVGTCAHRHATPPSPPLPACIPAHTHMHVLLHGQQARMHPPILPPQPLQLRMAPGGPKRRTGCRSLSLGPLVCCTPSLAAPLIFCTQVCYRPSLRWPPLQVSHQLLRALPAELPDPARS